MHQSHALRYLAREVFETVSANHVQLNLDAYAVEGLSKPPMVMEELLPYEGRGADGRKNALLLHKHLLLEHVGELGEGLAQSVPIALAGECLQLRQASQHRGFKVRRKPVDISDGSRVSMLFAHTPLVLGNGES